MLLAPLVHDGAKWLPHKLFANRVGETIEGGAEFRFARPEGMRKSAGWDHARRDRCHDGGDLEFFRQVKTLRGRVVIDDRVRLMACVVQALPITFGLKQFAGDGADRAGMLNDILAGFREGPALCGTRQSLPGACQGGQRESCVFHQPAETAESRDPYLMAGSLQALAESHHGLDVSPGARSEERRVG